MSSETPESPKVVDGPSILDGGRIGRNVLVGSKVRSEIWDGSTWRAGSTVGDVMLGTPCTDPALGPVNRIWAGPAILDGGAIGRAVVRDGRVWAEVWDEGTRSWKVGSTPNDVALGTPCTDPAAGPVTALPPSTS